MYPKPLSFTSIPRLVVYDHLRLRLPSATPFYSRWPAPASPRTNRLLIFLRPSGIKRPFVLGAPKVSLCPVSSCFQPVCNP